MSPPHEQAYLDTLHEQQGLCIVLVGFQDEVCQLVDDDVKRTLLLQGLTKIQLRMRLTFQRS